MAEVGDVLCNYAKKAHRVQQTGAKLTVVAAVAMSHGVTRVDFGVWNTAKIMVELLWI